MKDSRGADYRRQLLQPAQDVLSFTDGMTEPDFLTDRRTQNAVVIMPLMLPIGAGRAQGAELYGGRDTRNGIT